MSNEFTLESLRDEIEREYAPVTVHVGDSSYVLQNAYRLSTTDRDELQTMITEFEQSSDESSEAEIAEMLNGILRKIVDGGKGNELVEQIDGDLLLTWKLFERWMEQTQPGEASSSPS